MSNILGVKFRPHGQVYFFDSGAFVVGLGDRVIVKTDQGMGLGEVVAVRDDPPQDEADLEIKAIYRLATDEDRQAMAENEARAREAFLHCRECIERRALEMKLVDVEIFFDRTKMIFFFTAPGRIDFRELVKDLVRTYRTRIELRQIGVRHETQMVGAVGNCGMVACCRRFLRKFVPVTIKMAKEQNLFLNPTKISGICGRLLCCLSYEEGNYREFYRRCPKIGKRMATDQGTVKVLRANFFRSSLSVLTDQNEEMELTLDEWEASNPRRPDQGQLPVVAPRRERPPREPAEPETRPDPAPEPALEAGPGQADRPAPAGPLAGERPRQPRSRGNAPAEARKARPRRRRKKSGPKAAKGQ